MALPLFCFTVRRMFIAKFAIFFCFHTVWMIFLFFHGIVVTLLAVLASQGNFGTHNYSYLAHCSVKNKTPQGCQFEEYHIISKPVK